MRSATARASGIECDMWIVSISNGPALTRSPASSTSQRRVADLVLLELRAHQPERQRAAVDRSGMPSSRSTYGSAPDVVLVAVGEHDRLDVVGALAQAR